MTSSRICDHERFDQQQMTKLAIRTTDKSIAMNVYKVCFVLVVAMCHPIPGYGQESNQEKFSSLLKEYSSVQYKLRLAATDQERTEAIDRTRPYTRKFLELASSAVEPSVKFEILEHAFECIRDTDAHTLSAWRKNESEFPRGSDPETVAVAIHMLSQMELSNEQIRAICQRMWSVRTEYQPYLINVVQTSTDPEIRAIAALIYAESLRYQLYYLQVSDDKPENMTRLQTVYGDGYLSRLKEIGAAKLAEAAKQAYQLAMKVEGVKLNPGRDFDQMVEEGLQEVRFLLVGCKHR